jgi:aquaporin Z
MKKYIAEFLGTFFLVLVGTGGVVYSAAVAQSPLTIALGFGLTVTAGIYIFGPISGGHFNPAVSFAMALSKRLGWLDFVGYILAQFLGAAAAAGIVRLGAGAYLNSSSVQQALSGQKMTTNQFVEMVGLGETKFASGQEWNVLGFEVLVTFAFVLLILMITQNAAVANVAPIIIGLWLTVLILMVFSITGGSLNPARSLGPALYVWGDALKQVWVYFVGPLVGAGLAAVSAKFLAPKEVTA